MRCRGPHGPRDAKKMKPNCKPKLVRRDLRKVGGAGVPLWEEPEGPPGQGAPVREDFSVLHDGIKRQRPSEKAEGWRRPWGRRDTATARRHARPAP